MYSWEIDNFLQERNFTIAVEEMELIRGSSQVVKVIFCGTNNGKSKYSIYTSDNDNWTVWMRNRGN